MEHLGRRVVERIHELSSIKRLSLSLSPSSMSLARSKYANTRRLMRIILGTRSRGEEEEGG